MFCRIAAREIPSHVVFESEHVLGFKDIHPQAPTHVLFISKQHTPNLNDAAQTMPRAADKLMQAAVGYAAEAGVRDSGYRLVINTNRDGGQTVDHLHLHLLAGRQMHWPPG